MGKTTSSQDHSASSESGNDASSYSIHDEGKHVQNVNPTLFLCNPEIPMNASQAEITQPMFPYAYADPYLTGLFTAYGPHHMIQPQEMAAASGRVPLPGDLPEDGPIYVNAKQYHGILRRRQTRAKLEAQNKLLKNRRPYLHESRHKHALKRVRGSGGRFLSTKKPQHSDTGSADSFHFNHNGNMLDTNMHQFGISNQHDGTTSTTEGTIVSSTFQHHPEGRFSSISPHMAVSMQGNGGFVYNGNRHCASIVQ